MGVFDKTIIPLALVGYEMIIANEARRLSTISYPTRTRGIFVNYTFSHNFFERQKHLFYKTCSELKVKETYSEPLNPAF